MKTVIRLFAVLLAMLAALSPAKADSDRRLVVAELFTSQGCSSCPPADALLAELARRDDVVALSFHVTYWDRLGWRDPFATDAGTRRQYQYSATLRRSNVYTPQMVLDGRLDLVGSRRREVLRGIAERQRAGETAVAVDVERDGGGVTVHLSASKISPEVNRAVPAIVWMIEYDPVHETEVARGENRGRTLRNANVVRAIRRIATWSGSELQLEVALPASGRSGVVLVQNVADGSIRGVARVPTG